MKLGRTIVSGLLSVSLAACGGGGGSGSGGGSPVGGGTGGTTGCTLSARQDWVLGQINEWYLFPELVASGVNKAAYSDMQSYIDALVAPARAEGKDRYFTYITSIKEENDLIANGSNAGFGVRLSYDDANDRVFVMEAFEGAPALAAGIDRGSEILAINGQAVSTLMANGGPQAVSSALGPSDPGVTRTLDIKQPDGSQFSVTVTKADYSLDPVSDRYGVRIFDAGGKKVGYVALRTFIVEDAGPQLREAFNQFRGAGVTEVILDLRYNGGGLISVAELLGDLMGEGRTGQVFSKTVFRASKASNNSTKLFTAQPQAIGITKLAVIGREGTASASELVTNSFIPYLGSNIALVGTNTYGKPVGQIARDRSACDDRLRVIALRTVNAANQGDYYNGLAPVMPVTCSADDALTVPLGDPREASIAAALGFLGGQTCTPITAKVTAQAGAPRRELLQPTRPNAAQANVPGLY